MKFYMEILGPTARVLVVTGGMDMGPLPITNLESGFGFTPAMGLYGVVCKSGSN